MLGRKGLATRAKAAAGPSYIAIRSFRSHPHAAYNVRVMHYNARAVNNPCF